MKNKSGGTEWNGMGDKKISIEKIKAVLSMASMALLSIQHFVGLLAESIDVSYIPLSITFFTIYIGSMDVDEEKVIREVSLAATVLIVFLGCILYTALSYGIVINGEFDACYTKVMFAIIGILSLILSILYIKRIRELE